MKSDKRPKTLYLLCFDQKHYHAGHYLGITSHLNRRLRDHANGNGARLTEVIADNQIDWQLVRTWLTQNDEHERSLKDKHDHSRICPRCIIDPPMVCWDNIIEVDPSLLAESLRSEHFRNH